MGVWWRLCGNEEGVSSAVGVKLNHAPRRQQSAVLFQPSIDASTGVPKGKLWVLNKNTVWYHIGNRRFFTTASIKLCPQIA